MTAPAAAVCSRRHPLGGSGSFSYAGVAALCSSNCLPSGLGNVFYVGHWSNLYAQKSRLKACCGSGRLCRGRVQVQGQGPSLGNAFIIDSVCYRYVLHIQRERTGHGELLALLLFSSLHSVFSFGVFSCSTQVHKS